MSIGDRIDLQEYRRLRALGDRLPGDFEAAMMHPALPARTARAIFGLATCHHQRPSGFRRWRERHAAG